MGGFYDLQKFVTPVRQTFVTICGLFAIRFNRILQPHLKQFLIFF